MDTLLALGLGFMLGGFVVTVAVLLLSKKLVERHQRKVGAEIDRFVKLSAGIQREADAEANVN